MDVALKVDIDTLRGTQEGVPNLLRLLDKYQVRASFLFSLGPDHTGRALKRIFRPGFLAKVSRTSVTSHYGYRTLLYGTLLPGPNISKRCAAILNSVKDAGHEVGIHCYDHVKWQDYVANKDQDWTKKELQKACAAFRDVYGFDAKVHGAAGWQINPATIELQQQLGFSYASDVRGHCAFIPHFNQVTSNVIQIPTTLPTLDELIGTGEINEENVHQTVFELSQTELANGHVYTLHAELEGMKLLPVLHRLIQKWKSNGQTPVATEDIYQKLTTTTLPHYEIVMDELEGRSGVLALQGNEINKAET